MRLLVLEGFRELYYLGERYDFSLTCQIGFFLNMTSENLTAPHLSEEQIRTEEESHYIKVRTTPDWEEYDSKMSLAIEAVAADIYSGAADSMGKPEKVTEKFICRILGIKQHRLENMPKCRAVLERYLESYPESWARKLVWAYEWLENNEEDIFYWKHLRKLTGVKKEHFDEIIEFAELWDFLDVPIKNFSSGMQARLGFAIATMVRPDILVVDEILSVGDYQFQEKCYKRMEDMLSGGTTLLYVSHDVKSVRKLCDHAIWIDKGVVRKSGLVEEVTNEYMNE